MKTLKTIVIALALFLLGSQYANSQSMVNEHSIKFLDDNNSMLTGENGLVMLTTDGGLTWNTMSTGVTNLLYGCAIIDPAIMYAVGENGVILRTFNSGASWDILNSGVTNNLKDIELTLVTPSSYKTVVIGDNGTILMSTNFGMSWNVVSPVTTANLTDMLKVNDTTLFAVGKNATMLKSVDGGFTWTAIDIPDINGASIFSIGGVDANNLTILTDSYLINCTTDGGLTWYTTNAAYYGRLNSVHYFSATEGVAVGDNGLILRTLDGGLTWHQPTLNVHTDRDLTTVSFASFNRGITVGDLGINYLTTDGGNNWVAYGSFDKSRPVNVAKNKEVKLNQNFPNPFNPSTVISYDIPFDASVSVKIYDMVGREVANLVNSYQKNGNYSVQFNASNLSSGIYFYKLTATSGANKVEATKKMILTK